MYREYIVVADEDHDDPVKFLNNDGGEEVTQITAQTQPPPPTTQAKQQQQQQVQPGNNNDAGQNYKQYASWESPSRQQQQQHYSPAILAALGRTPTNAATSSPMPSSRPLSATLHTIMEATSPQPNLHDKGAKYMTSQLPLDKEKRLHDLANAMTRVGIWYCDSTHLLHLPGGYRGSTSFLVPKPPDLHAVRRLTAFSLQVLEQDVEIGYVAPNGEKVFFAGDDALRRHLCDQPRVVPFVQAFVTGNHQATASDATPTKQKQRQQHEEDDGEDDDGFFDTDVQAALSPNPAAPASSAARRPVSAPASRVPQTQSGGVVSRPSSAVHHHSHTGRKVNELQQLHQNQEVIRVAPSAHSERGLEVLPPVPSASSIASAWRVAVDCTITNHNNSNSAAPLRPLYSRPSSVASARMVPGPSSHLTAMGALASSLILFDGGKVNEAAIDKIYDQLCQQSGNNSNSSNVKAGVNPYVLLDYIDAHVDALGDKRRFERAMGTLLLRPLLNKDQVALVLLRLARE